MRKIIYIGAFSMALLAQGAYAQSLGGALKSTVGLGAQAQGSQAGAQANLGASVDAGAAANGVGTVANGATQGVGKALGKTEDAAAATGKAAKGKAKAIGHAAKQKAADTTDAASAAEGKGNAWGEKGDVKTGAGLSTAASVDAQSAEHASTQAQEMSGGQNPHAADQQAPAANGMGNMNMGAGAAGRHH